jgi:hypothetical protein
MKPSRKRALCLGVAAVALFAMQPSVVGAVEAPTDFDYSFEDIQNHLVVINTVSKGKQKAHCGFIATMDGKTYLFTSQHLILGTDKISFYSPSGRSIRPRSVELSHTRDIARLVLEDGTGFSISQNPAMGASIGVYNSTQLDNSNVLYGSISGVGADIVEVSADFTNEHSGSPILDVKKNVIGIASYVRVSSDHAMKKGTRFENRTRRFCYRLDRTEWKTVNWKRFNEEYGTIYREGRILADDVIEILNSWSDSTFDLLNLEELPEQRVADWVQSHNQVVSQYVKGANYNRKFSAEYTESAEKLSGLCRQRARKIRLISKQRGLTEFLQKEYDMQAGTLEYAADVIDHYGKSAY